MPNGPMCSETYKATGFLEIPKYRPRCIVCGSLCTIVAMGEHLVVGRHFPKYVQPAVPGLLSVAMRTPMLKREKAEGPMCVCVERHPGDAPDVECKARFHFSTSR